MRKLFLSFFTFLLTSCTYSVTLIHTEGEASDVVDEAAVVSPDIRTSMELPLP